MGRAYDELHAFALFGTTGLAGIQHKQRSCSSSGIGRHFILIRGNENSEWRAESMQRVPHTGAEIGNLLLQFALECQQATEPLFENETRGKHQAER